MDKIIEWMLSREITIIPATLRLSCFYPEWYTVSQSKKLIQKGFNPKMRLYQMDEQQTIQCTSAMTTKLGTVFQKTNDNFWFSSDSSKCENTCSTNCPDKKGKFVYSDGFRVEKKIEHKLGQGGFGAVYEGHIHGEEIGAKFLDVTDKYKKMIGTEKFYVHEIIPALLGDIAYEASAQTGFGHKNILNSKEWWIQFSKLNLIELVISTPKCFCNLKEWLDTETFDFDQIRQFLIQTGEALDYLAEKNLAHRDVKPSNILITNRVCPAAKLTDFGLMKSEGVTPVFCAPEQLVKNGTILQKTDVHGLGVTILFCLFKEREAIKILFGVISSTSQHVVESAQSNPILSLVKKMIQFDPAARPTLENVRMDLEKFLSVSGRQSLSDLNLPTKKSKKSSRNNTLKLKFDALSMVNITVTPSITPHDSIISGTIHDQQESGLCWAFSFSSLIRGELKRFIRRLMIAKRITIEVEAETLKLVDQLNKNNRLMHELVCLVVPRNPKLSNLSDTAQIEQRAGSDCVDKICSESLLRPAGWTRLPSIRRITDKLIFSSEGNLNRIIICEKPLYFSKFDSI